jgi:hypothetical protein
MIANRQELATYFNDKGFRVGAEVGVGDGLYAKTLLERISGLCLYGIDPWDNGGGNRRGEASYLATMTHLKGFVASGAFVPVRKLSVAAAADFLDGMLDFVFIDAAHDYKNVTQDLEAWTLKVKPGGIVSGHDYYNVKNWPKTTGVTQAVNDYVTAHGIKLEVIGWDRKNPDGDSRQPCWWFVR